MTFEAPVSMDAVLSADGVLVAGLGALEGALAAIAAIDPAEFSGFGLGDALVRLSHVRRQLDATTAVVTQRFSHSESWAGDGARSASAWIQGNTTDGYGAAQRTMVHAEVSSHFPALTSAWRDGDVSSGHIEALDRIRRRYVALQPHLIGADAVIADVARLCDPREFHQRLRALCHRFNADAVDDAERERATVARLHASETLDGFVKVDALLDPVLGARFLAALEAARRQVVEGATEGAGDRGADGGVDGRADGGVDDAGDAPFVVHLDVPVDRRPMSQRNLDALSRILDAATACTDEAALPTISGERPTINVTVPIETLMHQGELGLAAGWLERFGLPATMISAAEVRRLACDASLRPMLIDRQGQLIAMLPKVRAIHPALRRAIFARDVRCRFPGCHQRIDEVHHIVFHSHGGPTVTSNLVGLCWHHHHLVHDSGWHIAGDPGGRLAFRSPFGREMTSDPPTSALWEWQRRGSPT